MPYAACRHEGSVIRIQFFGVHVDSVVFQQLANNVHMTHLARQEEGCCASVIKQIYIDLFVFQQLANDFQASTMACYHEGCTIFLSDDVDIDLAAFQ